MLTNKLVYCNLECPVSIIILGFEETKEKNWYKGILNFRIEKPPFFFHHNATIIPMPSAITMTNDTQSHLRKYWLTLGPRSPTEQRACRVDSLRPRLASSESYKTLHWRRYHTPPFHPNSPKSVSLGEAQSRADFPPSLPKARPG